ncbi:Aminotransferase class-V [Singulisphaera sp. GP187]|uniref:aminotransferase class V-fold PLP-dependent enzyme n=1 Tax=Singulisphaera sp. GP187 TaxID=1882752 RepID=UPI00092B37DC|nr:aminotransferase class V-fold PLP-dependent enzyme [Singulisphaera sp. GP187]SIO39869.1 Aminotransferase class-V [Singulisphaera sp. GP187]
MAVSLAKALECWQAESEARQTRWRTLRDRLESGLTAALGADQVIRNGPSDDAQRLPQTLNLGLPGLDGDTLLMQLDRAGIAATLGSACASGSTRPSPTLVAMRASPTTASAPRSGSAWAPPPPKPRSRRLSLGSSRSFGGLPRRARMAKARTASKRRTALSLRPPHTA